jgi:hypothetical protein
MFLGFEKYWRSFVSSSRTLRFWCFKVQEKMCLQSKEGQKEIQVCRQMLTLSVKSWSFFQYYTGFLRPSQPMLHLITIKVPINYIFQVSFLVESYLREFSIPKNLYINFCKVYNFNYRKSKFTKGFYFQNSKVKFARRETW